MNLRKIRNDFPLLGDNLLNPKCIYFDSACMTLKPKQVINALNEYYNEYPACSERSAHSLAKKVTDKVDETRRSIRKFISAKKDQEIIFTKNTTESINLIANSLNLNKGDLVLTTDKEHNSNLVPWLVQKKKGILHDVIKSNPDNTFNMELFKEKVKKAKLVSVVHTSNIDGVTNPLKEIVKIAHEHKALVLADCAQSIPHQEVNVSKLGVDFIAFSGHKMLGPTGTGILYGKAELLEKLDPFIVGGETVIDTTYDSVKFEKAPKKFEAGLKDYSGIIGLNAAIKYLEKIGLDNIAKHEIELNKKLTQALDVELIGPKDHKLRSGIFSFNIPKMDQHMVAGLLNASNIFIRSGAHCAHSWFNAHNLKGSARASLYLYNTEEEVEKFIESIKKISSLK